MNTEQMQAAKKSMVEWLSHPQELGQAPAKMEYAGTFDLYEMRYYIFKYKKSFIGKWLLGVCGGYTGDEMEHCGHVFSQMEEYQEATAVKQATAIVEMIRSYWMEQAKQSEKRKENAGQFTGFVLLSDADWDKAQLIRDLKEKWDITAEEEEEEGQSDDALVFSVGDMLAAISLMQAPVPNGEAEENAKNNYMWPEAVTAAKEHKAHIIVAVLGEEQDLLERGRLYTKLAAACCRQKYATGVYTSGVVFQPQFYEGFADMMKHDELPVFNWIWFGMYRRPGGISGYTYGLENFGKDELEVLDANAGPNELRDFLAGLATYVLENDVELRDGETIGFSEDDKHAITRSEGVALSGMTLKITF